MCFQQIDEIVGPFQRPTFPETEFPTPQTNISEVIEENPSDFKRVRLLYQGHKWDEHLKKLKPILFMDARGRKFSFPFHLCHHWPGMAQLITKLFQYDVSMGSRVANGQYDIVGSAGNIISPQDWEATIEPGISVTMHMWSILHSDSAELVRDKEPSTQLEPSSRESRGRHDTSDDEEERRPTPRLVSPPREVKKAEETKPRGILRPPREKFPEDPVPIREGVAPLKDAMKDGVPPHARWTKISRRMVNPEALEAGKRDMKLEKIS
jgi:hypothetical protein